MITPEKICRSSVANLRVATGSQTCRKNSRSGDDRPKERIKTALVDHDDKARVALWKILECSGEYDVVGSYSSSEEAVRAIDAVNPQVVLIEIRMPQISGIECIRDLKRVPGLVVIAESGMIDPETISRTFAAGADSYLAKPFTAAQCLATIRFAVQRRIATSEQTIREHPLLTVRENEVMRAFANGLLYKEVADQLGISYSAVHKHQHKAFVKLRVANRSEAIRKWSEMGSR